MRKVNLGRYYGVKAWIVCAHALWDPDYNVMIPFEPSSHEIRSFAFYQKHVNTVAVKGLFTWKCGTPGRWSPLRWGNPPVNDQIEMRDYMDRQVTSPKRVTSPTWGLPPQCKQPLNFPRKRRVARGKYFWVATLWETIFTSVCKTPRLINISSKGQLAYTRPGFRAFKEKSLKSSYL